MWRALSESGVAQSMSLQAADSVFPPAHEFLSSAGFGGLTALLAAIIVAIILLVVSRRTQKHHALVLDELEGYHDKTRADQHRDAALARCWRRLEWVVDTAGIEPASSQGVTLGLGPELALEVLRGIMRQAEELGDEELGNAATVHLSQLSLVLAQQSGPLTRPGNDAPAQVTAPESAPDNTTSARPTHSGGPESSAPAPADVSAQTLSRNARPRRSRS